MIDFGGNQQKRNTLKVTPEQHQGYSSKPLPGISEVDFDANSMINDILGDKPVSPPAYIQKGRKSIVPDIQRL